MFIFATYLSTLTTPLTKKHYQSIILLFSVLTNPDHEAKKRGALVWQAMMPPYFRFARDFSLFQFDI
jgi:hypothetical protein